MSVAPTAAFLWGWGLTGEAPRERQEWGMAAFLPSPPPHQPWKAPAPKAAGSSHLGKAFSPAPAQEESKADPAAPRQEEPTRDT